MNITSIKNIKNMFSKTIKQDINEKTKKYPKGLLLAN